MKTHHVDFSRVQPFFWMRSKHLQHHKRGNKSSLANYKKKKNRTITTHIRKKNLHLISHNDSRFKHSYRKPLTDSHAFFPKPSPELQTGNYISLGTNWHLTWQCDYAMRPTVIRNQEGHFGMNSSLEPISSTYTSTVEWATRTNTCLKYYIL